MSVKSAPTSRQTGQTRLQFFSATPSNFVDIIGKKITRKSIYSTLFSSSTIINSIEIAFPCVTGFTKMLDKRRKEKNLSSLLILKRDRSPLKGRKLGTPCGMSECIHAACFPVRSNSLFFHNVNVPAVQGDLRWLANVRAVFEPRPIHIQ
jgi:hypothetical protein